jgi:hypothetical protein
MGRISGRGALAAGFGLVAREPAAFLVWCVVCFLLGIVPQVLTVGAMLQMMGAITAGGGAFGPEMMAAQQQALAYQPLTYLTGLALLALVPPAVFRAVLRPEDRGILYLRLGMREFWVAVIVLVMFVMYFIALLVAMIPVLVIVFIATLAVGGQGGAAAGSLISVLLLLAAFGVIAWGALRFSMAPIMAFADNTFRLTESWTLTKGHAWKMFLVGLALVAITIAIEAVLFSGLFLAAGGSAGLTALGAAWQANPASALQQLGVVWLAAAIVVMSLLSGAIYAIWGGAWADMYRQLRVEPADVF